MYDIILLNNQKGTIKIMGKYQYQLIRDLREDRDLTQKEIAEYLKITQQQYQLYESGEREIKFHQAIDLAKYYNVSLDYLVGLTNSKRPLHK